MLLLAHKFYISHTGLHERFHEAISLLWENVEGEFSIEVYVLLN